jgi:gliding motility-associated protein GldL
MGLFDFTRTKRYRNFMAKVYGIGASIVLVGALFKIIHLPGANLMLTIGLLTEAVIFFFSAFEPPHVDPDWSLVYPELAGMYHDDVNDSVLQKRKSPSQRLDEMLEKNNINDQAIAKLGEGLNKLSTVASQLSEVSEATVVTKDFAINMKQASETAKKLTQAMTQDLESAAEYSESLKKVANNAAEMLKTFDSTTTTTTEFASQIKELNGKISSLNKVYGNMLSAMRVNG